MLLTDRLLMAEHTISHEMADGGIPLGKEAGGRVGSGILEELDLFNED